MTNLVHVVLVSNGLWALSPSIPSALPFFIQLSNMATAARTRLPAVDHKQRLSCVLCDKYQSAATENSCIARTSCVLAV